MSRGPQKNLPASVRQRLLNLSRERGEDSNFTLTRYANERLLKLDELVQHADQVGAAATGRVADCHLVQRFGHVAGPGRSRPDTSCSSTNVRMASAERPETFVSR